MLLTSHVLDSGDGSTSGRSDATLTALDEALARARRGDERAFAVVFTHVQPRLLRYLRVRVGGGAQDVASETWLRVCADLHRFDGPASMFLRWVFTIARCRAIDALRATRQMPVALPEDFDIVDPASAADSSALSGIALRQLLAAVQELPPDQAEAVTLRYVAGLDAQAAGEILGKTAAAVRVNAHRGLRRLSRIVASDEEVVA